MPAGKCYTLAIQGLALAFESLGDIILFLPSTHIMFMFSIFFQLTLARMMQFFIGPRTKIQSPTNEFVKVKTEALLLELTDDFIVYNSLSGFLEILSMMTPIVSLTLSTSSLH